MVDQLGLIPILIVPDEKTSGMFEMEGDPFRVDTMRIKRKVFSRRQLKSALMEDRERSVGVGLTHEWVEWEEESCADHDFTISCWGDRDCFVVRVERYG